VTSATAPAHVPARTRPRPQRAPARRRSGATTRPRAQTRRRTAQRDYLGLLDRLLRGPAYIALVFALLVGIVFFNVGVLQLNHGIAGTDVRTTQLERQNAMLTQQLAKLASSERIQRIAIQHGLVLPLPGDVHYLRANPGDAARAVRVMSTPAPASAGTTTLVSQASSSQLPVVSSQTGAPTATVTP
jgi:cell division protein FtsL